MGQNDRFHNCRRILVKNYELTFARPDAEFGLTSNLLDDIPRNTAGVDDSFRLSLIHI